MKTLYLHIGLPKTGSSSIQFWCAENQSLLEDHDIFFADINPKSRKGIINAGNGLALRLAIRDGEWEKAESLLREEYFGSCSSSIVSSETFSGLTEKEIQCLASIIRNMGVEAFPIAFMRSVYEDCYSAYQQHVKRHGGTFQFGERGSLGHEQRVQALRRFYRTFGEKLIVRNYDHHKDHLIASFTQLIGLDLDKSVVRGRKVNRSLTQSELNLLIKMNLMHKGLLSEKISDYLIEKNPEKSTPVYFEQELLDRVIANSEKGLEWVNRTFFQGTNEGEIRFVLDSTLKQRAQKLAIDEIDVQSLRFVVEWCLDEYDFADSKFRQEFVHFLCQLAAFCEEYDKRWSHKLIMKALEIQPDNTSLLEIASSYQAAFKPIPKALDSIRRIIPSKWITG